MNQPMNTKTFLSRLEQHNDRPLIFEYDGTRIQPGYHVTEVKRVRVESLDCGANPEGWTETVVQLWDVPGKPGEGFMTAGKFRAILEKVHSRLPLELDAPLMFEYGDTKAAIRLLTAPDVQPEGDHVLVRLEPKRASCKPNDRWLQEHGFDSSSSQPIDLETISLETVSANSGCCTPNASSNLVAGSSKGCC